ncbi:MAG TPA: hypothetical protein VNZ22_22275, partial [Bacillota bacterium]|nr:hypothetical protein [Bacillota bacterium]
MLQDHLQNLDQALERKRADLDALWDKARMVLELQDQASAEPLLRQILASTRPRLPPTSKDAYGYGPAGMPALPLVHGQTAGYVTCGRHHHRHRLARRRHRWPL